MQCGRAPKDAPVRSTQLVGDGIGRLGGASSKHLSGRVHSTAEARVSSRHVPGSCFTFLSTCSKDCGAHAAFSDVRRVTEPTPSQNGSGNPRQVSHCWQVTKETPLPRKTRWTKAKKCTIPSGSPLIEEGLSDGHRVKSLVLRNREVHSGYYRCPTARHHFLWPARSLEHISAPTPDKTLHRQAETQN